MNRERRSAALPSIRFERMKRSTLDRFAAEGIGLLRVAPDGYVDQLMPATTDTGNRNGWRLDNLWRRLRPHYTSQGVTP